MKKLLRFSLFALSLFSSFFYYAAGLSQTGSTKKIKLQKPDIRNDQVRIGVNNWSYVMLNNGSYMLDAKALSAGGEFPRASGRKIVYSGGFNLGVIKNESEFSYKVVTKVQPSDGGTQMQPGAIMNSGVPFSQLVASDPNSADNRVYYIDDTHSEPNWPGFVDDKGDAVRIAAAQTWAVFNNLDTTRDNCGYAGCPPFRGIGAEVVLESFSFNTGPAADAVFLRFSLVNETNVTYGGAYFSLYMDPDVETYANDIVGSDSVLGLGFCYNGDNSDLSKSVGIDVLQGPVVNKDSVDPGLAAKFASNTNILVYDPNQNILVPTTLPAGKIWLGATSFVRYADFGSGPRNDTEMYNLMAGGQLDGTPKTGCGDDYKYAWPGDPVTTPAGCANGVMDPALGSDVRMILNTGPFTFSAGDTQVVWATVIGATGTDRLSAVAQLKTTDALVQNIFDNGLVTPKVPATPKISVTPLDGKVIITWDDVPENEVDTYGSISGITTVNGYSANYVSNDFQGYRVYRSRTGLPGSFTMLAQYDLPDGITTVTNRKISANGNLTIEEILIGTDSGLRHEYIDTNVVNNHSYYYTVTAYDAQPYIASPNTLPFGGDTIKVPAGIPGTLESDQAGNVVMVRPMKAVLGTTYNAVVDTVAHTGPSDGSVTAVVIDPALVQTGIYSVKFIKIPSDSMTFPLVGAEYLPSNGIVYHVLLDTSLRQISSRSDDPRTFYDANANGTFEAGDIKLDESYFGEDQSTGAVEASIVVDGIKIKVSGTSLDFVSFDVTANAGGPLNPPAAGAATFQGFPSSDPDLFLDQQVNGSFWFVNSWRSAATTSGSYADYVANAVTDWAGWDLLVPNDFEYRFTATGQMGMLRNTFTIVPIPFEVWNATTGTQLLVDLLNDAGTGSFQLVNEDHPVSGGTNDPRTCRFYVTNPRDMSPGSGGYNYWLENPDNFLPYDPVLGRQVFVNWNGGEVSGGVYNAPMPEVGTIFRINTTKPNSTADVFTFTGTANTVTTAKKELKKGLKDIKVVPNPFYIFSSFDTPYDKAVKFMNLPASCTIRIFTVAGDLVRTLRHNASSDNDRVDTNPYDENTDPNTQSTSVERWDLKTVNGRYAASGIYIAVIETSYGKTVLKFAVIQ